MHRAGTSDAPTADRRALSTSVGYALVLVIVLVGTVAVVTLGSTALQDTRGQSELDRAQHAMTLFDSRAAMVALGTSTSQAVTFGHDSGQFKATSDAGYIRITHENYTESSNGPAEEIYNGSLGAVVYENGPTTIAYQGGGVWRVFPDGQTRMLSPPEFHYREATLTLPVIRVSNDASGAGNSRAVITNDGPTRPVFPNVTDHTGNGTEAPYDYAGKAPDYLNPIKNGSVYAWIHGEYYDGWATYFRERTTGNVTVWDANQTVRLELVSLGGAPGAFDLPEAGNTVDGDSMAEGHPISEFDVELDLEKQDSHFSFYDTDNGEEFELHLTTEINPNNACPDPDDDVHVSVYYYNGSGEKGYESFETPAEIDPDTSSAMEWECRGASGDDLYLLVDFVDSSVDMVYDEIASSGDVDPGTNDPSCGKAKTGSTIGNKYAFNRHMEDCDGDGWELRDETVWDQHEASVSTEPKFYREGDGDTESMDSVVNHYMQLMGPDLELVVKTGPGNSDPIDENPSTGSLTYEEASGGDFIAYLHVTENDITVEFD